MKLDISQMLHSFLLRQCSAVFLYLNCLEYVKASREISEREHLVHDILP